MNPSPSPTTQALQARYAAAPPSPGVSIPTTSLPGVSSSGVSSPGVAPTQQMLDAMKQRLATPTPTQQASQSGQPQGQTSTGSVSYKSLAGKGFTPVQIEGYLSDHPGVQLTDAPSNWDASIQQNTIVPKAAPITEHFGENQPGVEVFSGGFTSGTGIGIPVGTPVATPPGKWTVVSTVDNAKQKGFIGDSDGQGWGNNIVVKNSQTGEELRYSHLSEVQVHIGDSINGNRIIGQSGQSGNVTGPHLNLEYITPDGKPADVLQSQYAEYIPIKQDAP